MMNDLVNINDLTVACGVLSHKIYLTSNKSTVHVPTCAVTEAAVLAVRDYMVGMMGKGNSYGYSWKRKDGKVVKLVCAVEDNDD